MKYKFTCECGEDITSTCKYTNEDGYFYIFGYCEKCKQENSVDLTDWLDMLDENYYEGGD